ncbi:MAG TPA: D-alanine--D-alanine ligase family protein [Thermoanaerobaculia bacterium]|nr:D-alanine--D-alanine ligase family protein [Thermoanaerobaculia bacterium]HUM30359.1 D-alanine--D-alanine ligase family protein [Thermoanaerobaculia bacterium]HXK68490.1 D-alanine--D-alanine ligase family protein [Thermoanaerobaculia bacterium]
MRRLAILFGGPSVEHDVSIISARSVYARVDRESFDPVLIGMTRDWQWVEGAQAESMVLGSGYEPSQRQLHDILGDLRPDVVFPLVHGTFGEDGNLQAWLQSLGYPYVGCGVRASALGMDKAVSKALWAHHGLPVVPWRVLHRESWKSELDRFGNAIHAPVFVKPADSGSSVGISHVSALEALPAAVESAFAISRKVMIEPAIKGRELEVAVLGGYTPDVVSVPGEIVPGSDFYDYDDKYVNNKAQVLVPASLPEEVIAEARRMAASAYTAVDAYGMARVDFFLDREKGLLLNEINTIPGFTPISMYPKLMEHSGISFTNLITQLADLALLA